MIFKPELAKLVIEGKKTQTRRIAKAGEKGLTDEAGTVVAVGLDCHSHIRMKWVVGQDYAVCPGRGKAGIGRMKITEIRKETLMPMPHGDWSKEGFVGLSEFISVWNSINTKPGTRWQNNPEAWVISFELVEATNG